MKIPRDCPDWIVTFLNEQRDSIYIELTAAKNVEDLLRVQGRAVAVMTLRDDIEMRATDEEEKTRELVERMASANAGN